MKAFRAVTPDDLVEPADYLAARLHAGRVVCFYGEMGAGKTTFIKTLLAAMGVEENIDSPTFAIVNEYRLPAGMPVFHFDFYRLKNAEEAIDIGLEDYLDAGGICLMEWPEMVEDLLPDDCITVKIEDSGDSRKIEISTHHGSLS